MARKAKKQNHLKRGTRAMSKFIPLFTIEVEGVEGSCPAGEKYGDANMAGGKIPVFRAKVRSYLAKE